MSGPAPRAGTWRPRHGVVAAGAALLLAVLVACGGGTPTGSAATPTAAAPAKPGTLRVIAGSEVADLEGLLPDLKKATGVDVKLSYTGTLDGTDRILHGTADADASWFSSDRYLQLLPGGSATELVRTPTMSSPVVLGVRTPLAEKFGWTDGAKVTWADIAAKVASGELTYAMTNPASSNSGFSALVGVAAAFAGTHDALQASDIKPDQLKNFFGGQVVTAGSSKWLSDSFVSSPDTVGGMINYESVLLTLQRSGSAGPLTLVYPSDGVITADYPMVLLNSERRDEYTRVVNWLRSPDVQQRIMSQTGRRPVLPTVKLDPRFGTQTLFELPFPATQAVADELLNSYLDTYRRPSHTIYTLDISGSMAGTRLRQLQDAVRALTGADDSLVSKFARFRAREKVTIITFNSRVVARRDFTVTDTARGSKDLAAITGYMNSLQAGGSTAVYSALSAAYDEVARSIELDPGDLTSVVLMTDGENNAGISSGDFTSDYNEQPTSVRAVHTFAVLFGESDRKQLTSLATTTGGSVFDATVPGVSLANVFQEIRGYQ